MANSKAGSYKVFVRNLAISYFSLLFISLFFAALGAPFTAPEVGTLMLFLSIGAAILTLVLFFNASASRGASGLHSHARNDQRFMQYRRLEKPGEFFGIAGLAACILAALTGYLLLHL